jgi:hypothetical protein
MLIGYFCASRRHAPGTVSGTLTTRFWQTHDCYQLFIHRRLPVPAIFDAYGVLHDRKDQPAKLERL